MAKYGRIRSVYGMYTVVYDTVYDRLRPYTESVTVDLGMDQYQFLPVLYEFYANKHKFPGENIIIALHWWMVSNSYRLKTNNGVR